MKQVPSPCHFTNKEKKAKRDGVTSEKNREETEEAFTDTCLVTTSNSV